MRDIVPVLGRAVSATHHSGDDGNQRRVLVAHRSMTPSAERERAIAMLGGPQRLPHRRRDRMANAAGDDGHLREDVELARPAKTIE
jgi:hypothetical protein